MFFAMQKNTPLFMSSDAGVSPNSGKVFFRVIFLVSCSFAYFSLVAFCHLSCVSKFGFAVTEPPNRAHEICFLSL